jgi:hypothetical protein
VGFSFVRESPEAFDGDIETQLRTFPMHPSPTNQLPPKGPAAQAVLIVAVGVMVVAPILLAAATVLA